jgi:hypothetical protein
VSRPLLVLFLTILVNLIGFGIIVPLLPFYATTYGASPVMIGLLDLGKRPHLRVLLSVDFIYWMSFAVYQTTFALFGANRFGFDAAETGYFLAAFGFLGVIVQGALVGPIVLRLGERRTLTVGLLLTAIGWAGSALTYSLPIFMLMLVPGAAGIGLCNATLSALISHAAGRGEQGRVQGAGPGAGSRRSAGKRRPRDRTRVGQQRAAALRRGKCLRRSRRAARRRVRRDQPLPPTGARPRGDGGDGENGGSHGGTELTETQRRRLVASRGRAPTAG